VSRPGAVDTLPSGINSDGLIAGTSETAAQTAANVEEGFVLRGRTYRTIFFPGARDTDLGGINDGGEVLGTWGDFSGDDHCFIRDADGDYKSFDIPFPNNGNPDCLAINNPGDTVGHYFLPGRNHGWLRTARGTFSHIDVTFDGVHFFWTEPNGINDNRDIVGMFQDASNDDHGFLLHRGKYYQIDVPFAGATQTNCYGINNEGDIVGSYRGGDGNDHGFVLTDGRFRGIDVNLSDAKETNKVTGINDYGWMVGVYTSTDLSASGDNREKGFKVRLDKD
jgi:hypothetical protein